MATIFSIDLETTGLNSSVHGVIEFAAIMADTHHAFKPQAFHRYLRLDDLCWSEYCLKLHASLIPLILTLSDLKDPKVLHPTQLRFEFERWLMKLGHNEVTKISANMGAFLDKEVVKAKKITAAGKNFATFDKGFLEKLGFHSNFRQRVADPAILYWDPEEDGDVLPDTKKCYARVAAAGGMIQTEAAHTALEDALGVVDLVTFHYSGQTATQKWGSLTEIEFFDDPSAKQHPRTQG